MRFHLRAARARNTDTERHQGLLVLTLHGLVLLNNHHGFFLTNLTHQGRFIQRGSLFCNSNNARKSTIFNFASLYRLINFLCALTILRLRLNGLRAIPRHHHIPNKRLRNIILVAFANLRCFHITQLNGECFTLILCLLYDEYLKNK